MKVTLLVPTLNEAVGMRSVMPKVKREWVDQILIVDGKSKDGTGLVNLGMAFATAGQFDKGASLIQQGITKGGMSRIEEAKLQLGVVYYWGGKKDQAIQQLKTVTGTDGTGELARFWLMQINHPLAEKAGS